MAQVTDLRRRFRNTLNRTSQAFLRAESLNTASSASIIAVDTASDTFTVSGDQTGSVQTHIWVDGSTANDAIFTVASASTNGSGDTDISVEESIKDGTADGSVVFEKTYEYRNMGRVKEVSVETDMVGSDMDQDGRTSAQLLEFSVSQTLQQGSNEELSRVPDLNRPPIGGNTTLYPRGQELYRNGHFVYFSGNQQVTTGQVNAAVLDSVVPAEDGELQTQADISSVEDLHEDLNGILFQNVLLDVGPSLDLSAGQSVITIEFGGTVQFDVLDSLDSDRKIAMSPSSFFDYV